MFYYCQLPDFRFIINSEGFKSLAIDNEHLICVNKDIVEF